MVFWLYLVQLFVVKQGFNVELERKTSPLSVSVLDFQSRGFWKNKYSLTSRLQSSQNHGEGCENPAKVSSWTQFRCLANLWTPCWRKLRSNSEELYKCYKNLTRAVKEDYPLLKKKFRMALRRPGLQEFSLVEFTWEMFKIQWPKEPDEFWSLPMIIEFTWTRIEGRTPTKTSTIEKKNEMKKLKLVYSSKINIYELIGLYIGRSRLKTSLK